MSQITKKDLAQSLKNLLLKKPLNKITINDITDDYFIDLHKHMFPDSKYKVEYEPYF